MNTSCLAFADHTSSHRMPSWYSLFEYEVSTYRPPGFESISPLDHTVVVTLLGLCMQHGGGHPDLRFVMHLARETPNGLRNVNCLASGPFAETDSPSTGPTRLYGS